MTGERLTDGVRIAQLLASEITGNEGRLQDLALADADPDVEPTTDGALAYTVVRTDAGGSGTDADGTRTDADGTGTDASDTELVAEAYVQPDRVRVEFVVAPDAVAEAASEAGLRVRPKAVHPPRTLVFVEDGAQVKRVLTAFEAAFGPRE